MWCNLSQENVVSVQLQGNCRWKVFRQIVFAISRICKIQTDRTRTDDDVHTCMLLTNFVFSKTFVLFQKKRKKTRNGQHQKTMNLSAESFVFRIWIWICTCISFSHLLLSFAFNHCSTFSVGYVINHITWNQLLMLHHFNANNFSVFLKKKVSVCCCFYFCGFFPPF